MMNKVDLRSLFQSTVSQLLHALVIVCLTILLGCQEGDETTQGATDTDSNGDFYSGISTDTIVTTTSQLSQTLSAINNKEMGARPDDVPADCAYAANSGCVDGKKVSVFTDCPGEDPGTVFKGSMSVEYNNLACDFVNPGDSFQFNYAIHGVNSLENTAVLFETSRHHNYLQELLEGGENFTLTQHGFIFESKGKRSTLKLNDTVVVFSDSTETPLTFEEKNGEVKIDGIFVRDHNLLKYSVRSAFDEVRFDFQKCCHPLSGQLELSFSGSKQGQVRVTFDSTCGVATLSHNAQVEEKITLNQCL